MTEKNQNESFDLTEAMSLLAATPGTLSALLEGLPDTWLDFREDPEAWSPRQVFVHFIHNERANFIPRARVMLSESGDHKFPPFRQMPEEANQHGPIRELLAQFTELRRENLATVKRFNLTPCDFDLQGEHPVLGTVSLGNLLATWVVHDLNHTGQIVKTLAKRYREAVGPWRQNLAILDR